MKKQIEIEVDIPDGWEFVRFDRVKPGEWYVAEHTGAACGPLRSDFSVAIIRREWKWPEWLTARWIYKNASGEWWASMNAPGFIEAENRWCYQTAVRIDRGMFEFTPPPCDDWRQSLRRNPNISGGAA